MWAYLVIGAVVIATAIAGRNTRVTFPPVVLLYGLVIVLAVYVHNREQSDAIAREHDRCVFTAERSIGNRQQWLFLISVLQVEIPNRHDLVDNLQQSLDLNLPALDAADC